MKLFSSFSTVACIFGSSTAQLLKYSPPGQSTLSYTFAAAHPNVTGGVSDIFIQIQGPASMSWIAVGQGESMKGSQMFIIYANAAGNNVTLSPRLSRSHDEPSAQIGSKFSLLPGSGIVNGNMTANIFCQKCDSWSGGSMNLSGPAQSWIWASRGGTPIKSDSISANLQQHDDGAYAAFALDWNLLSSSHSSNPFLDPANSQVINAGNSSGGYDGTAVPIHGVIMCLVFIVGFPLGAFLIRLASFRGLVWIHAIFQSLSYLGAIIGLALGVYVAKQGAANLSCLHPVLGIAIIVLLLIQPILGYIHHLQYRRYHTISLYTHFHVWFGRFIVTAGIIDGLLGIILAGQSTGTIVAYCVISGGVWILWIAAVIYAAKKQRKAKVQRNNLRMVSLVNEQDVGTTRHLPGTL